MKLIIIKLRSSIALSIIVFLGIIFFIINGCVDDSQRKQKISIDFTQADLMLEFLIGLNNGKPVTHKIDSILHTKGTELVVKQMNIVRRVSLNQYEQLLLGLVDKRLPDIQPIDSTERAKRGVQGLKYDVWVILTWALDHTEILKERLAILKQAEVYLDAKRLAHQYLPEPIEISPTLFIVMGGRAGAAALEGNQIYIDILKMTHSRIRKNMPFMKESEMIEYFAHEMHHLGLSRYYQRKFGSLLLDDNQRRLFSILRSIVAEGSATYLINNHCDIREMREYFKLSEDPAKQKTLLRSCEELIIQLSEGKFNNQDDYEKANKLMLGQGYHLVGSIMLSTIDQAGGWESVKQVLADPRTLLLAYNKAANSISEKIDSNKLYIFNSELAQEVSKL